MPPTERPYISFVATARNDDHGLNLLARMQTFVNSLTGQCHRHDLPAELVLVEWNPVAGRPKLSAALSWPSAGRCTVRIIEVSHQIHQRFRHSATLPLYQMIAKNVGIRRALGEFVVATNIDIIFSDELIRFLASRSLEKDRMYRIDRLDVMSDVPGDRSLDEQLEYCRTHLLRVNAREGTFPLTSSGLRTVGPQDIAALDNGIYFGSGWYAVEQYGGQIFRWVENGAELLVEPPPDHAAALSIELEPGPGVGYASFSLLVRDDYGAMLAQAWVHERSIFRLPLSPGPRRCLRLEATGSGHPVAHDSRSLDFRVYRCAWERDTSPMSTVVPSPVRSEVPGEVRIEKLSLRQRLAKWSNAAARAGRVARQIWRADGEQRVGLPIPPRVLERLRLRLDAGGLSMIVPTLRPRRPTGAVASDEDFIDPGTRLMWGGAWYPAEYFASETFRWARNDASVLIFNPGGPPQDFFLLLEPGPAVGFRPFPLEFRDQWGASISSAIVRRRTWVKLPLAWKPGKTHVISLHAESAHSPKKIRDSRTLFFRVLRGGWGASPSSRPLKHRPIAPENRRCADVGTHTSGIFWGWGWDAAPSAVNDVSPLTALDGAEIIFLPPSETCRPVLDVEAWSADGSSSILELYDPGGKSAATTAIAGRAKVVLPIERFLRGNFYLFTLHTTRSSASANDATERQILRLFGFEWTDPHSQEPTDAAPAPSDSVPAPAAAVVPGPTAASDVPPADRGTVVPGTPEPARSLIGPVHLHTNGCGDFTLLARNRWLELRGYPEFDMFSMNLDSLFCWAAHHAGLRELILKEPFRIYHIEHATGSGWTPAGQTELYERITAKGVPWLDNNQVLSWARNMNEFNCPMIFNLDNWGLADEDLPEVVITHQCAPGAG